MAADFTVAGGESAASQLLSANPQIDAIWNHDDDQGIGVLAAIDSAGRDEFFMVGGAGSKSAMEAIEADDSVLKATVIYPSTQGADGVALARLIAQEQDDGRPDHARHPEPDRARRSRRHEGQRRPVHRSRLRVEPTTSRGARPTSAGAPRHDLLREDTALTDTLRVAMIGHGFMGAAHSQGWRVAPRFFDLPREPEMTVVVGRDAAGRRRAPPASGAGPRPRPTGAR